MEVKHREQRAREARTNQYTLPRILIKARGRDAGPGRARYGIDISS